MDQTYLKLNDGNVIPQFGMGVYQVPEVFGGTKVTKQMLKMLEECPILSKHFLSAEDKHYLLFQVDIINTEFN